VGTSTAYLGSVYHNLYLIDVADPLHPSLISRYGNVALRLSTGGAVFSRE
jgi:hypothetical protein